MADAPKQPKELSDTGKELAAVNERLDEISEAVGVPGRKTPIHSQPAVAAPPDPATEAAILKHASECEHHGPLSTVAQKLDTLRTGFNRLAGAVTLVGILLPIGFALWNNHAERARAEESVRKTLEAAAKVADQLKAVQEAAKGHTQLEPLTKVGEQLVQILSPLDKAAGRTP